MKSLCAVFIFVLVSSQSFANDVYLSTGYVYRNVTVDTSGSVILINMGSHIDTVQKSIVLMNTPTAYHNQGRPRLTLMTPDEEQHFNQKSQTPVMKPTFSNPATSPRVKSPDLGVQKVAYKNTVFITLGALGGALAWDQFTSAGDMSNAIDGYESQYKMLPESAKKISSFPKLVEDLRGSRTRAYIVGGVAAIVGFAFTIYALTPVEVTVTTSGVNLSYNF